MAFDLSDKQSRQLRRVFLMVEMLFAFLTLVLASVTVHKYSSGSSLQWSSPSHNFIIFTAAFTLLVSPATLLAYWAVARADTSVPSPAIRWLVLPSVETILAGILLAFWFFGSIAIAVTTKANSDASSKLYTGSLDAAHIARATIAFSFITTFVHMLMVSTLLRDMFKRNRHTQYMFTNMGVGPGPHLRQSSAFLDESKSETAGIPEYRQDPAMSSSNPSIDRSQQSTAATRHDPETQPIPTHPEILPHQMP
ncbi:hypothetical protein IWQ60_003842 [Tieghemiomyces parasiticus]|uniref:MARVEL domain-containing protein n=1 Tax=Tieghemiomyces parasiticus TaxID=78921 RepID=A0A9W8AEU2_9FUNG|nr:hypothetical protein IWQ60_003842 [Tieghemiomyces parasiticus]